MDPEQEDLIMEAQNFGVRPQRHLLDEEEGAFIRVKVAITKEKIKSNVNIRQIQINLMESILTKLNDLILPTFIEEKTQAMQNSNQSKNQVQLASPRQEVELKEPSKSGPQIELEVAFGGIEFCLKVKKNIYSVKAEGFQITLTIIKQNIDFLLSMNNLAVNMNHSEIVQKLSLPDENSNFLEVSAQVRED